MWDKCTEANLVSASKEEVVKKELFNYILTIYTNIHGFSRPSLLIGWSNSKWTLGLLLLTECSGPSG